MLYSNALIYALLNSYTTVLTIKDYFKFNGNIMVIYNIGWWILTIFAYILII